MIELLVLGGLSYGFMKLCKKTGKTVADKKYSKTCPRCGTTVKPDGDSVSNLYWKGTMGYPVYHYTCPHCHYEFDNRPY